MLILILIDVQYLHKAAFSFEKGSNCQNHSSSGSLHMVKQSPHPLLPSKISDFPHWGNCPTHTAIWKTLQKVLTGFLKKIIQANVLFQV